jgi:hypothetical protein
MLGLIIGEVILSGLLILSGFLFFNYIEKQKVLNRNNDQNHILSSEKENVVIILPLPIAKSLLDFYEVRTTINNVRASTPKLDGNVEKNVLDALKKITEMYDQMKNKDRDTPVPISQTSVPPIPPSFLTSSPIHLSTSVAKPINNEEKESTKILKQLDSMIKDSDQ